MGIFVLLIGPTVMIGLGLQLMHSVPITFVLFYGWLLLVPLIDYMFIQKIPLDEAARKLGLSLRRNNIAAGVIVGIISGLTIVIAASYLYPILFEIKEIERTLAEWGFSGNAGWLILILVLVNPLFEELYWRAYVYQKLLCKVHSYAAIGWTALFYSAYHLLSLIPLLEWPYPPCIHCGLVLGLFDPQV
jgi:membrane protease YdiL (CAAX protease family)